MTDIALDHVTGVLLAGGLSRRMGGGDKGLREVAGRTMLDHVIGRFRPQVAALVINANGDPVRLRAYGLPVVPDTVGGFAGPLAGVLAGMRWSAANAPDVHWIATTSTDAPFIPSDLVARLRAAIGNRTDAIALAASAGEVHPVIGLWPVALADDLERQLRGGMRKILHWTDGHGTIPVEFPFTRIGSRMADPFFNANTPEELDEARRLLESRT